MITLFVIVIVLVVVFLLYSQTETNFTNITQSVGIPNGTTGEPSLFFGGNKGVGLSSNNGILYFSTPG